MADDPRGLIGSTEAARLAAGALQDPDDLEDLAVRRWLNGHHTFEFGRCAYVLVPTVLVPLRWRSVGITKFTSLRDAQAFFKPALTNKRALAKLIACYNTVTGNLDCRTGAAVVDAIAAAVLSGQARLYDLSRLRKAVPPPRVMSRETMARINGDGILACEAGATAVDCYTVSKWEGFQKLKGYVPIPRSTGIVAGNSGLTIATAFDLGQIDDAQFAAYDFDPRISLSMKGYVHKLFKGMAKKQVVDFVVKTGLIDLTKTPEVADEIDFKVWRYHLQSAVTSWDKHSSPHRAAGVPAFVGLPGNWQTVVFSRTYHQGTGMPEKKVSQPFYRAAVAGKWDVAILALRNYHVKEDWYKQRVSQEASWLQMLLPPPTHAAPPSVKPAVPIRPSVPAPSPAGGGSH